MGRVINFGGAPHHPAEELLPWFVNGTLEEADDLLVARHLEECVQCRHEVDALRALRGSWAQGPAAPDPGPSFRRLRSRLTGMRSPAQLQRLPQPSPRRPRLGWASFAIAAQLIVIVALGVLLFNAENSAPLYRTLGPAGAGRQGTAAVAFDPRTTAAEIHQILSSTETRIVDGPTTTGAYVLQLPAGRESAAIEALRAQRGIVLAERLDGPR